MDCGITHSHMKSFGKLGVEELGIGLRFLESEKFPSIWVEDVQCSICRVKFEFIGFMNTFFGIKNSHLGELWLSWVREVV